MVKIGSHPLIQTLRELKGNPRAAVLTEPLFGIPYNLFYPFMSVFMLAMGLNVKQIGTITTIGLLVQVLSSYVSGALVDKFGRRWTLFITDLFTWTLPAIIWAVAQNGTYFFVAAVLNGFFRIAHTAWTCLMQEDAEERHLVHIWTWVMIFAVCSAFFTPLGGLIVNRYGLIPAMRGLLWFGAISLALKASLLFAFSSETERGKKRIEETRHRSLFSLLGEYRLVASQILKSKPILAALSLMVITNIYSTINNSFWSVLITGKLGFADAQISYFAAIRSVIMALCFFVIGPKLTNILHFRLPLWIGFSAFFISQLFYVVMPPHSVLLVVLCVLLEAVASALVNPMTESLLAVSLESKERARVSAVVYTALIIIISPFGWIGGQLSAINPVLPFALNMLLFALGGVLVWLIDRYRRSQLQPR